MAGKRFRFSLDQLLRLRRHETARAEQEVAAAIATRRDREEEVQQVEDRLHGLADAAPDPAIATPKAFRRHAALRDAVLEERRRARHALQAARRTEARAREALVEARRPEEALDRLREREQAAHRRARRRAEDAAMDEQAGSAHHRRT